MAKSARLLQSDLAHRFTSHRAAPHRGWRRAIQPKYGTKGQRYRNSSRADLSRKWQASYADRMAEGARHARELDRQHRTRGRRGDGARRRILRPGGGGKAFPLARAIVFIDMLHPIHEGRVFRWERDKPAATVSEYGRSTEGEAAERWRKSPHYRLLETAESLMRRRVTPETEREFAPFPALWEAGITEFVAAVNRFSAEGQSARWTASTPAG